MTLASASLRPVLSARILGEKEVAKFEEVNCGFDRTYFFVFRPRFSPAVYHAEFSEIYYIKAGERMPGRKEFSGKIVSSFPLTLAITEDFPHPASHRPPPSSNATTTAQARCPLSAIGQGSWIVHDKTHLRSQTCIITTHVDSKGENSKAYMYTRVRTPQSPPLLNPSLTLNANITENCRRVPSPPVVES